MKDFWKVLSGYSLLGDVHLLLTLGATRSRRITERGRPKESGNVLKQILDMPDKGVRLSVLGGSKCIFTLSY
jgi:hypothetical protein